jgi:hypothetical protein
LRPRYHRHYSRPQQGKDVLREPGVVLRSEMDLGTRPPGPLGCPLCVRRSLVTNYANCCWTLFTSAKGGSGWREQDRRLDEKASIGRSTPSFWLKAPCVTYFRMAFLENNFTMRRNDLHNSTTSKTTRSRNAMDTSRIAGRTFGIVDAPRLHHESPTIRPCPR